MKTICSGNRTLLALAAAFTVSNLLATSAVAGQRPEVQRLFQSGAYDEAVQAAQNADPASVYVAAQAMVKAEQPDRAREQFSRLRENDNPAWQLIAQSGDALVSGDSGRAVTLARQAVDARRRQSVCVLSARSRGGQTSDWEPASSLSRGGSSPTSPTRITTPRCPISGRASCRRRRNTSTPSCGSRPTPRSVRRSRPLCEP